MISNINHVSFKIASSALLLVSLAMTYRNCIPATAGSIGKMFGFSSLSSLRNPANMAAQESNRLNTPSNMGWTTGANGRCSNGLTRKKLILRSRTSIHVRSSSCNALAPGKMPSEKKTMPIYASQVTIGTIRIGSWTTFC